jgi:hypothetical protein
MDRLRCHRGSEMSLNRPVGHSMNFYSMFWVRTMNELREQDRQLSFRSATMVTNSAVGVTSQ